MSGSLKNEKKSHATIAYKSVYRPPKIPRKGPTSPVNFLSCPDRPSQNILADTAIVLLGSKQSMHEQNRRCPVRVVRDWFGRLVQVVHQGHSIDGGRAV